MSQDQDFEKNNTETIRRFIAGAKCEKCGAEDKVYIDYDENRTPLRYGCVACGFVEHRDGSSTIKIK